MSLIRCLNNPEGLYVWSDATDTHFMNVTESEDWITIPNKYFQAIMEKCQYKYDGRVINKISLDYQDISIYLMEVGRDGLDGFGKIRIGYNEKSFDMWGVTFFYIYSHWVMQNSS